MSGNGQDQRLPDKPEAAMTDDDYVQADDVGDVDEGDAGGPSAAMNGNGARNKKKKPRLHWDEQNLIAHALEKERNPYPKIDEPKTPYHTLSGSEGGSSSGSAPQSPGSPAFISRDHLYGFDHLERSVSRGSSESGQPSRTVSIIEDAGASSGGDSSPRSREEFEAKRKQHYRAEYPKALEMDLDGLDEDTDSISDLAASKEASNGVGERLYVDDDGEDLPLDQEVDENRNNGGRAFIGQSSNVTGTDGTTTLATNPRGNTNGPCH